MRLFFTFTAYFFSFIPYKVLEKIGNALGFLAYHIIAKYRKRTLSNLSLAADLNLDEKTLKEVAKNSFKSFAIAFLEFPKLLLERNIKNIVDCENPWIFDRFREQNKGIVFLCAHQSNWELFFLDGNSRMPGVAIGRPIKNKHFYDFILRIRTKFGGEIIEPQEAMKKGLKALKEGKFLGIVGDQGMPSSGFKSKFLGVDTYSTVAPALLAYKTNSPVVVATMKRVHGKYKILLSDPILPNIHEDLKSEVERITLESLKILETSIKSHPHEWLWIHNRFKQETSELVYYKYRHESIVITTPSMKLLNDELIRKVYPKAFITYYTFDPEDKTTQDIIFIPDIKNLPRDYRFKFLIDFTGNKKLQNHFKSLSILKVLTIQDCLKEMKAKKFDISVPDDQKIVYTIARNPQELMKAYAS